MAALAPWGRFLLAAPRRSRGAVHAAQLRGFALAAARQGGAAGSQTVAFVGLGAMGYQMAKHLAIKPLERDSMRRTLVWNRTARTASQHAEEYHSVDISSRPFSQETIGQAAIVFTCLPTSDITFDIVKAMAPHLSPAAIVVDCCSGHPTISRKIAAWLGTSRPGIRYVDCPISGGPTGASKGSLAAMLGGDQNSAQEVRPHIAAFASNIVHLGPVGSGHAVKAVNNACNVSNLLCLHEGLLALKKMGVDPSAALEVINKSSGRSLMSQARVPEEVITGEFNYGFKLGLMAKDVSIATDLLDEYYPKAAIYRKTLQAHYDAMAAGTVTFDSDYTEIVKHQERQARATLRTGPASGASDAGAEQRPAAALAEEAAELRRALRELRAENEELRAAISSGAPRARNGGSVDAKLDSALKPSSSLASKTAGVAL